MDPHCAQALGLRQDCRQRVVGFAVGKHHQDPIGEVRAGRDQLAPLPQRQRQPGAALGSDVRVEGIEVEPERGAVD